MVLIAKSRGGIYIKEINLPFSRRIFSGF